MGACGGKSGAQDAEPKDEGPRASQARRMQAVRATLVKTQPPSDKTGVEQALLVKAIVNNPIFQYAACVDAASAKRLVDIAWVQEVSRDTVVVKEGDCKVDYFYIIKSGKFTATSVAGRRGPRASIINAQRDSFSLLEPGSSFGELSLLYMTPCPHTVKAVEDSVLYVVDRPRFKDILMHLSQEATQLRLDALQRLTLLDPLLDEEKALLVDCMLDMHFEKGEVIAEQGERGHTCYFLYDGELLVTAGGRQLDLLKATEGKSDPVVFREKDLLSTVEPREASVVVQSSMAKVLGLDRNAFDTTLGSLKELVAAEAAKKGL